MKISFENWQNLTGVDAYIKSHSYESVYCDISEAINNTKSNIIDPSGVLGVLMKNYCIGDRTLVQGISKVPFMSKVVDSNLIESELKPHLNLKFSDEDIANTFIDLMTKEAIDFIKGKKNIGILLSGGMDSRIVAAIIKKLQNEEVFCGNVVALTWGIKDSRDVVYSERIANMFDWDFIHIPLTSETLFENILLAGSRGAEYSPIHLHAMHSISNLKNIDGIFAGSYGDSIGRGEYSGVKAKDLQDFFKTNLNLFGFLKASVEKNSIKILKKDINDYRNRFPGRTESSYREMEMQMHYMRRQLNSCMSVINEKIPLHQMFTIPDVFGYVWSLNFECRTDNIYEKMLMILNGKLLDIPWARNGKKYNDIYAEQEDTYSKTYHKYGDWLRNEHRKFITEKILNGNLQKLGIFNDKALFYWCKNWRTDKRPQADILDEKMAWLASLSIFVEQHQIKGIENQISDGKLLDSYRLLKARGIEFLYYHIRQKRRN